MRGFPGVELSLKPVVSGATDLLAGNGDNVICCFVIVTSLTVLLKLWGGQDFFLVIIVVYSHNWYGQGKLTNLFASNEVKKPYTKQSTNRWVVSWSPSCV